MSFSRSVALAVISEVSSRNWSLACSRSRVGWMSDAEFATRCWRVYATVSCWTAFVYSSVPSAPYFSASVAALFAISCAWVAATPSVAAAFRFACCAVSRSIS